MWLCPLRRGVLLWKVKNVHVVSVRVAGTMIECPLRRSVNSVEVKNVVSLCGWEHVIFNSVTVLTCTITQWISFFKQLFNGLRDGSSTLDKITKEEVQRNIDRALQRYLDWARDPEIPPGQDSPQPQDAYIDDDNEEEMKETEEVRHEEL